MPPLSKTFAWLAGAVLGAMPAFAQQPPFQPAIPPQDRFDWIQFNSGEWLKGELIAMYDEQLEFESDQLDELTVDWSDVRQVRTAGPMRMLFVDRHTETGRLVVDGDTVRVIGAGGELVFARAAL